ncbi:MAG: hypothetical protein M3Y08_08500 [Fibrobacterota bacterium]|nr:hypothetical protein [Fibrobacterota bacterium]
MDAPKKRNRVLDGLLLAALVVGVHFLAYRAAMLLFLKSQDYSADAGILVVGNSRVEQGIMRRKVDASVAGGAAFLASQGMDLKMAAHLAESHLVESGRATTIWMSVDPWQLSEQYGEQGYRSWLPLLDRPVMNAFFREEMKDSRRDYWFMKGIPLLRFNAVKARLMRTAMGLGGLSVNDKVVSASQIDEVLASYAEEPLKTDGAKLRDLADICAFAEARGVALRLFFMPVIPELARPWDIPGFRASIDSLLRDHPTVRFIDFNDRLREHAYFRDTGHLNRHGAKAFSAIFADSLNLP